MRTESIARATMSFALALGLLLTSGGQAPAQDAANPLHTASRTELDVVKVLLVQEKAWNAGDLEGYLKAYKNSPDTVFIGRQLSRGYNQIVDEYRRNYMTRSSMGTLSFSELQAHTLDDGYAICLGHYHLDRSRKDGGTVDGMFSLVLEKTDSGWKIILDHTT